MPSPGINMHIDDVSRRMEAWLKETVSGTDIAFISQLSRTGEPDAKPRINVCFQSITTEEPDRVQLNRDAVYLLNYLLTVTGTDALANQRIYSEIFFAAHANGEFKVGVPAGQAGKENAQAFDGKPAVLALSARLVRPSEAAEPGIVTFPLDVRLRSLGSIAGKVVTEAGAPVMRAEIDAQALNKRVVSDAGGHFTIPGAPVAGTVSLTVRARNRSVDVSVDTEKQAEIVIVIPKENEHA